MHSTSSSASTAPALVSRRMMRQPRWSSPRTPACTQLRQKLRLNLRLSSPYTLARLKRRPEPRWSSPRTTPRAQRPRPRLRAAQEDAPAVEPDQAGLERETTQMLPDAVSDQIHMLFSKFHSLTARLTTHCSQHRLSRLPAM